MINNTDRHCLTKDDNGDEMEYKYFTIYPKVDGRLEDISLK